MGAIDGRLSRRSVIVPQGREFGAKGAALLAGVGIGLFSDVQSASRSFFRPARTHVPDPCAQADYAELYQRWRAVQQSARAVVIRPGCAFTFSYEKYRQAGLVRAPCCAYNIRTI